MKKIDLHIHTVKTISDREFTFSIDTFKRYVADAKLDAVAVTNHDVFDSAQFRLIRGALPIVVFPGIEINVDMGHVLVIARPTELDDFQAKTAEVSRRITKIGDRISVEALVEIFGDLGNYLVIPHYDKGPAISGETLVKLAPYVCAGEVDSAKKFVRNFKDPDKLTPVLFSDSRMAVDFAALPTRQTFVDCGEVTLEALKACLRDKAKVALSERDGNNLWQVFDDGQQLSTGLNVVIGARSTGKSHTLDRIADSVKNVKYIRQFSLVQHDASIDEREFKDSVERRRSLVVDEYLASLKRVLDVVIKVDLSAHDRRIDEYINTLLRSAEETDKRDAFSKAALFDEVEFAVGKTENLHELISSVRHVIENIEYRSVIEKHMDLAALKRLARELIEVLRAKASEASRKRIVNELVKEIRQGLSFHTSAPQVQDVDLYAVAMDRKRVKRFTDIVDRVKKDKVVFQETLQGFKIEARSQPFAGAGEIKAASGTKLSFGEAFRKYDGAYAYLRELMKIDGLAPADYYKLFAKVSYRILNKDGHPVSGGERSEFRLLQEIADARNYDLLLIDEPESSFDNLFLKSEVNQILKSISSTMPVVVVTHNSTVGASIGADYLLFTTKKNESGGPRYRIFSGHPTDKILISVDGETIVSYGTLLDSLEAGAETYEERREAYEAIKDR
ncbi:MAG: hypothetical protein J0H00_15290 [Burkholderiales bacterium]|nr:hypothetical protein [Burkholderiales bacterium]OJX03860.1 MAG: phosphotransferase [Burkholderiales bacterium 70-64]